MNTEKITDSNKRLKSTQDIVNELSLIHHQLIVEDIEYKNIYSKAEADITRHISLSKNTILNPIQICLNAVYGMLLLKLDGKGISPEQRTSLINFGFVLSYLSDVYKTTSETLE